MQIIFNTASSSAGCAPDSCYYIPYQKPLVYDADGDAAAAREDCHPTTIVADLRVSQPMENGEGTVVPAARRPQLWNQCN